MQDSPGLCSVPCHVLVDNILCILPTTDILALSTTCRHFWSLIGSNGTLWPSLLPYVHKRQNKMHVGGSTRDSFTDSSSDISGVYYSWEKQYASLGFKNHMLILAQEGEDLWSGRFIIRSRSYIHRRYVHLFGTYSCGSSFWKLPARSRVPKNLQLHVKHEIHINLKRTEHGQAEVGHHQDAQYTLNALLVPLWLSKSLGICTVQVHVDTLKYTKCGYMFYPKFIENGTIICISSLIRQTTCTNAQLRKELVLSEKKYELDDIDTIPLALFSVEHEDALACFLLTISYWNALGKKAGKIRWRVWPPIVPFSRDWCRLYCNVPIEIANDYPSQLIAQFEHALTLKASECTVEILRIWKKTGYIF